MADDHKRLSELDPVKRVRGNAITYLVQDGKPARVTVSRLVWWPAWSAASITALGFEALRAILTHHL